MSSPTFELTNKVVRAGAGAGKTTNLTERVLNTALNFYREKGAWPKLVVTTFTRKATQELRERLIVKACERKDFSLLDFVSSTSRLHISTLHGVFNLFLKRYAHLLNYDSSFTIISDVEAKFIAKSLLKDIIFSHNDFQKLLEQFSFDQLTNKVCEYSKKKLEFENISFCTSKILLSIQQQRYKQIALDFAEMQSLILDNIEKETWRTYVGQFSTIIEALREESPRSGMEILELLSACGSKPRKSKDIDEAINESLTAFLKGIKSELVKAYYQVESHQLFAEVFKPFEGLAEEFSKQFKEYKMLSGKFEMSDLELITADIIRQEPELARHFSKEWDYWLIDEYQDTSPIQVKLLQSLIAEKPNYIVGDPQQSIYLFRGARSEVFTEKESKAKSTEKEFLQQNWRSAPELLEFFNDIFASFAADFNPMRPRKEEFDNKQIVARFHHTATEEDEDLAILNYITEKLNEGTRFDEICVIARKHKTLNLMAQYLNNQGIPTHVHSAKGFFSRQEIRDALSLLKFLVNPFDNKNLIALLRSPFCKVPDQLIYDTLKKKEKVYWHQFKNIDLESIIILRELQQKCHQLSVSYVFETALNDLGYFDISRHHDATGRRESNLWKLVQLLRVEERRPGFNVLNFINSNVATLLGVDGSEEGDAVAALEPNCVNLMTIHASKGLQFDHVIICRCGKKPDLSGKYISTSNFNINEGSGLWSFAIPMGEENKLTPSLNDKVIFESLEERELEESLRLFYVALTRAKNSVLVSWSDNPHKLSWMGLSQFQVTEGLHKREKYSYEVLIGTKPQVELRSQHSKASDKVLLPLNYPEEVQREKTRGKISVSKVVEENFALDIKPEVKSEATLTKEESSKDIALFKRKLESSSRGSEIHSLLELLKYKSFDEVVSSLPSHFSGQEEQALAALGFIANLSSPPIMDLIRHGEVEWGYQLKTKKGIIEGQIDLWGVVDQQCWVIDYKSGTMANREKAFKQLELYALALYKMGQHSIKMAVVYPIHEKYFMREAPALEAIEAEFCF